MKDWQSLRGYLPEDWWSALAALSSQSSAEIQELRLRRDAPVEVSLPNGRGYLGATGISTVRQRDTYVCSSERLERCFLSFCQDSVYAHEWELSQGYLSVAGGIRVGVAGTAVVREERVCSVQNITSLCVRLPRPWRGCSLELRRRMLVSGRLENTLLVGPPSSGKTTLLRDLSHALAAEGIRVALVDERGELSGLDGAAGCDVLRGYPKAVGIRQAIRCLAPDVVVFDELGDAAEVRAVTECVYSGVAVVSSLHGLDRHQLAHQPLVMDLVGRHAFRHWVFLSGRDRPGRIADWCHGEVWGDGVRWLSADCGGGSGPGSVCGALSDPPQSLCGTDLPSAGGVGATGGLLRPPYGGFVASASRLGSAG